MFCSWTQPQSLPHSEDKISICEMFASKGFHVNSVWWNIMKVLNVVCEAFLNIRNADDEKVLETKSGECI